MGFEQGDKTQRESLFSSQKYSSPLTSSLLGVQLSVPLNISWSLESCKQKSNKLLISLPLCPDMAEPLVVDIIFSPFANPLRICVLSVGVQLLGDSPARGITAAEPSNAWGYPHWGARKASGSQDTGGFLSLSCEKTTSISSRICSGLQWFFFFQVQIGHFLVFKMLFSWPFVSFTTGSCLGLQSSAPHTLSGQMEMLIPQATLATHSSCFRSSKASGSYLQEYILPGLLLVLNIGCPQ